MSNDRLSLVISVTINVVALVFLGAQLYLLREQVRQAKDAYISEQRRARKQSTLDFISATLERRLRFQQEIPSVKDPEATLNFIRLAKTDEAAAKSILGFLNYYEYIAAGVNAGILDIDVIDSTMGTTVMRCQEGYVDFVAEVRERDSHPTLYEELDALAKLLRELRSTKFKARPH